MTILSGTREQAAARVGDLRQLASVRRIVLDDGPERDVRALAFSTGGGLDFWVLADRSMDIGPLWWRGTPLAWQGPNGFRSAGLHAQEADGLRGFERSLSGFLVTCGLTHVRQPAGGLPLHGHLPLTPARLLSHGENWDRDEPVLFCEGEVTEATHNGPSLRLHRRIEAPIGGNELRIVDRVENLRPTPQALAMLYHFNLGYPLVQAGTIISGEDLGAMQIDEEAPPSVACHAMAAPVSRWQAERPAQEDQPGLRTTFAFETTWLNHLQIWQDMRPYRRILGIEPVTSQRLPDGTSGPGPILAGRTGAAHRLTVTFDSSLLPGHPPC
ncbi:MAG TPA: DUF4432 family protein [Geminicoccus sp.]|uniref:DUF4432 family protein n=1 Tax=Geminicoccus sp. TaxID=2024832 RepID=UPI002BEBB111|nr:DUF4432 family protein [Geminicoccus sp.]HWL68751.1 DUF4432 family protein [Geminicoccus sp.]